MKGRRTGKEPYKKAYLKKKHNSTASHGFLLFQEDPAAPHRGTAHLHRTPALHHLPDTAGNT